jgi:non-specific serine/threonine protein kinase
VTDAERLFVERARLQRPGFVPTPEDAASIAEICRRLDGMPLAIELAAARTSVLAVGQIAARLHDRFRLLTAGTRAALPRQQTLRAAMDWSYELLTDPERAVLRALAVFAGDFTLEAAEAVCDFGFVILDFGLGARPAGERASGGAPPQSKIGNPKSKIDVLDLLARLVDKSLVLAEEQAGVVRYRLLETVRQYAEQRLDDAGDARAMRRRHVAWCLALAAEAAAAMDGPQEPGWLARLEQEHDNLRAALNWSLEQGHRLEAQDRLAATTTALRLAGTLSRFWELRGYLSEGRRWLSRALAAGSEAPAAERARALHGAGSIAFIQGDFAAAQALCTQGLALYQDLDDEYGIAQAQWGLGRTASRQGDYAAARGLLEASLAWYEYLEHQPGIATLQYALGVLSFRQGDYAAAAARHEASLAVHRRLGNKHGIANSLAELASALWEQDQDGSRPAQFEALLEESLALYRELGEKNGVAAVLGHRGMRAWARGQYEQAQTFLAESMALYRKVENRRGIARLMGQQGLVAHSRGDRAQAAALCRESVALHHAVGESWEIGRYLWVWGAADFEQGQPERAASLFGVAAVVRENLGAPLPPVFRPPHDSVLAALRETLGEPAFASAWANGQALSIDEAIDH